jgi:adenylate cyclase
MVRGEKGETMSQDELAVLSEQLAQKERELEIILAIDRIRDLSTDPKAMLTEIAHAVGQHLDADLCLLGLVDRATGQLDIGAVQDRVGTFGTLDEAAVRQLMQAALELEGVTPLAADAGWDAAGPRHLLAAPLVVGGESLGTLLLANRDRPFEQAARELFIAAISQADSAAAQARMLGDLKESNRQLEVVYQIDRIRDQTIDADAILSATATVIVDAVGAECCLLGLVDEATDQVELKAIDDRMGLLHRLGRKGLRTVLQSAMAFDEIGEMPMPQTEDEWGLAQVLVAPLTVEEQKLGVCLLVNREGSFHPNHVELVRAVVSQLDSAIAHARAFEGLVQRRRQLEVIYQVDRIRDETNDVQQLLSAVANAVTDALQADLCLMSLVSEESGEVELRAIDDRSGVFGRLDRETLHAALARVIEMGCPDILDFEPDESLVRYGLRCGLGAPLRVGDETLGALLLLNAGRSFGPDDLALLKAVVSQTDSAVVYARTYRHLQLRNKELETIYRVDSIRDQILDFNVMLNAVLNELCQVMKAETGFIMLFDESGYHLELKASTEDDILVAADQYELIEQAANEALHTGDLVSREGLTVQIRSILCVPLVLRDQIIGVFGVVNRYGPGGFTRDDKRLLRAITSQVDTAIFESLDKRRIRSAFERYVGETVMEEMLGRTDRDFLAVDRMPITVLYSDMRGFTPIAERTDPAVMVETLNEHLGAMTEVVLAHQGTLDKFVGDEVVALFGAPLPMADHALRAVETALEMQVAHQALLDELAAEDREAAPIGIGINSGEMVVGNIGCEKRVDYTAIGDAMNLGARLCSLAQPHQIIISESTYQLVKDAVEVNRLAPVRVKGRVQPEQIYEVLGVKK